MQVDGRLGPLTGGPRGVGQAARVDLAERRGAHERAPEAPSARAPLEDVLDLEGEPFGTLTVRGLEVAFDAFRDRELDLLERWGDARVDHERRAALERAAREIAEARRASVEEAPPEEQAAPEAGAREAREVPSGLPVESVSLPPLAAPAGAQAADEAEPRRGERRAEAPEAARASEGYLALPPESGLVVDLSA
jgi:hypothetical protein